MTATQQVPGVLSVRLSALDGQMVVRYDPSLTTSDAVSAAVSAAIDEVER